MPEENHLSLSLSERERQLLSLATLGYTDSGIANRLGIGETTVKTYWRRIRAKSGCNSRTEIVAKVLRSDLENTVSEIRKENFKHAMSEIALGKIYKRLLDEAPDAILLVTPEGIIKVANIAAEELFGWTKGEMRGQHISVLLPERYRRDHDSHVRGYVAAPVRGPMTGHLATSALHRNGSEFPVDASLAPFQEGEEEWVICIVRNIDSRTGSSSNVITLDVA